MTHFIDGPTGQTVYTGWEYINGRRIFNLSEFGSLPTVGLLAM